mgnify:CR=1 FL=1
MWPGYDYVDSESVITTVKRTSSKTSYTKSQKIASCVGINGDETGILVVDFPDE